MLCRRCGMESRSSEVCEWCKKPMLPPVGGDKQPSGPSPEEQESQAPAARPGPPGLPKVPRLRIASPGPSGQGEGAGPAAAAPGEAAKPMGELRPLGEAPSPAPPPHDLPVLGSESITPPPAAPRAPESRPVAPEPAGGAARRALAAKRAAAEAEADIPEHMRVLRSLAAGVLLGVLSTLAQYFLFRRQLPTGKLFNVLVLLRNPGQAGLGGVLLFGGLMGLALGFMLGAVQVRYRLGPVIGIVLGAALAYAAAGAGVAMIAGGAITGVVVGGIAQRGRRPTALL